MFLYLFYLQRRPLFLTNRPPIVNPIYSIKISNLQNFADDAALVRACDMDNDIDRFAD